ncbi:hypothetical protein [Pseudomonas sp. DTU12.3]|uniref:hypothetical protein n=1 Tax=Pseudomonas sp. DTU12.3 TaxID=2073078 RepID=UPI001580A650|nr:hypothetical protein [Pseudomonas sp. DTU12.3]
MSEQDIHARDNFIVNGDFRNGLDGWKIDDERKVTRQEGLWQGQTIGFMNTTNMGEGSQSISLATLPRPTPGRAEYKLLFSYEAVQGAVGTLRINPGLGEEVDLRLVPSRLKTAEPPVGPDGLLLDLYLVEYSHMLALGAAEQTVIFTVISPDNGGPGRPGAVRFTLAHVELLLEPLRLDSVSIDGAAQPPDVRLHLCFGAVHELTLQLADDSVWLATQAGLLVNDEEQDPENILNAGPVWGREHPVADPWRINCAGITQDIQIERTLGVRSQYTAETCELPTVCGHFQLDVVALQEAKWYPVIDLAQQVDLRIRVQSHYTETPLANREVTWTLKGTNGEDDVVLASQPSDPNGESLLSWAPGLSGDWLIEASVDSYYKQENARHVFAVKVLKEDPWLSARFALDGPSRDGVWGSETAHPCRGASHAVSLAFAAEHLLAETELALHWAGEDTPDGLGMSFMPLLDDGNPLQEPGQVWTMECGNLRDSFFTFTASCSKLQLPSPPQALALAHNWLELGEVKLPTRFPSVGGAVLPVQIQVLSRVPDVGPVSGVDVLWLLDGTPDQTLSTGDDGWSQYAFNPQEEGSFTVTARIDSRYDSEVLEYRFEITVLPENPLAQLTAVTLAGEGAGTVGLLCARNAEPVELLVKPVGETLIGESFYLKLVGEDGSAVDFHIEPDPGIRRPLPKEGLPWQFSSQSTTSSRFLLYLCHDEITPYELPGRLFSSILEDEGTFSFDERPLDGASTAYPCLGGEHRLQFMPNAESVLTGLDVTVRWKDDGERSLDARLVPDYARELPSSGLEWTLDAVNSTESAALALAVTLPQAHFAYPAMTMLLAHNRNEIAEVRGPTFDLFIGESTFLEVKSRSYYTRRSVPGTEVSFVYQGTATPVPTGDNGWARFAFTATQPGTITVVATVPSPYDGPDAAPSFTFEFTVLAAVVASDTATTLPDLNVQDEVEAEIVEVREPTFDPQVGENVVMGLKIRLSQTRHAASGIEVTFWAGQTPVRVVTDSEGWAFFSWKVVSAGDIEVLATLDQLDEALNPARSHVFKFTSLNAGVWNDALIQLNDLGKTVWGEKTLFPRISQVHTIRLSVDKAASHLLNRDICLGLKGYSTARELGLTSVQPALGTYRQLTSAGLSWQCTGTIGGAYALQLEASRLLKQSPLNPMSLGPVPSAGQSED